MKRLYWVLLIASLMVLSSLVTYSAEAAGIPKGAISTTGQWATTDLPKGTITNGFLKASTGNTPSYSTISAGDVPDLSSTYAKLNGGRVPNSLLPDAVVRTNQTNTFGAYAQTFASIILGGNMNVGSYALTNAGHASTLPTTSGTLLQTNGTFSGTLGTLLANTFSYLGHVITIPSNTGTLLLANGSGSSLTGIPTSITGTLNNITASSSTGAITLNLGSNAVTTGGSAQTVSKAVTFSNTATINGLRVSQSTKVSSDSPYTVQSTDGVIYADATSGSITINLPTPSTVTGQIFVIKRIDSSITNTVTVATSSGYIDSSGTTTKTLDHRNQYVGMQSDGTNYRKILERSYSAFGYMPKGSSLNRFVSSPSTGLALSTASILLNTMYTMPLVVEETSTIDTVQIKTTTRVAGSFARVGIYSDSGNTQPASLIADFGTLSTGTAGVVSSTTASPLPITLSPGLYWLAIDGGSSVSVQGFAVGGMISLLGDDSGMGTAQGFGWSVASSCGGTTCPNALPSTFPTGSVPMTAAPLPQIAIRLSN